MKRILLIATGGTIASVAGEAGLSPAMTGKELALQVPLIEGLCKLDVVQPMNIDSTNMRPCDWLCIAREIRDNYDSYDGFVILHGTDTMAYTAAALSYLIQNNDKPIVLTGSQQPMGSPFTDAKLNVYQSLLYALDDESSDVSVVFGGEAIAGTRARKQRTMSFNAFSSVNYPALAIIRNDQIVRVSSAHKLDRQARKPCFYDKLNERVIVIKLTPKLQPSIFALLQEDYDAIILETFGIGGVPEYPDASYKHAIDEWITSGRSLVMTTQVPEEGLDLGVYEVGHAYANKPGILQGGDMTSESLVAKTMWVLGQTRDTAKISELFYCPVNHDRS
ncbi:asparaginase [Olegusella massiliensis]|uniref:asparaginase n=1 Tax=Olegusella massiliensis TaxID=1776381 RepID=UPI0023F8195E|nr:asparaginase [Olegusella massiliensis]